MRLTTTTLAFIVFFCLAWAIGGQTTDTGARIAASTNGALTAAVRQITLQECIRSALDHNFEIQIQSYRPQIFGYDLAGAYGAYDPIFSSSISRNEVSTPGGIDELTGETFSNSERETDRIDASLSGLLPWGLAYSLGGNLNKQTSTRIEQFAQTNSFGTITNIFSAPFTSVFHDAEAAALNLRQPLLRNFWTDATRTDIKIRKRDLRISELGYSLVVMDVVNRVEVAYYELIFALENVVVQEKALELATRSVFEIKKKVEVGTEAPLEEKQAEAEMETARADLINARLTVNISENVLKSLITDNYRQWHGIRLVPTEKLQSMPQVYNLEESWMTALSQRPDYLQQMIELEKLQIATKFRRNQILPDLDLFGSYGHSGLGRTAGDALHGVREGDTPFHSYGVGISLPLSFRTERNALRAAKASQEQARVAVKRLEQVVQVQIDDAVNTAKSRFEAVSATRQAAFFAEAAYNAEQKKFENGKSTGFLVLQFQRDLTQRRSEQIRALADYNQALADLHLRQGTTLNRHQINLFYK